MSWTRKNDGARLYQEPGGGYLLLIPDEEFAVGNVYEGPEPSLCGAPYPCASYLTRCKRVAWNDLPAEWQEALLHYMRPHEEGETTWNPADYRGLWRIGEVIPS